MCALRRVRAKPAGFQLKAALFAEISRSKRREHGGKDPCTFVSDDDVLWSLLSRRCTHASACNRYRADGSFCSLRHKVPSREAASLAVCLGARYVRGHERNVPLFSRRIETPRCAVSTMLCPRQRVRWRSRGRVILFATPPGAIARSLESRRASGRSP